MNKVSLRKMTRAHAEALQVMVSAYIAEESKDLQRQKSVRFHSALQETALSWDLYFDFRKKIETGPDEFNMQFRIPHAVTLLYACSFGYDHQTGFTKHTALLYRNALDQALQSIPIPPPAPEPVRAITN